MNVDYSQYKSWQKVIAPNGQVYYRIPDTGYLYDPFVSAAKGYPVYFSDPTPEYERKKQEEDYQKKARDQALQNASPAGQLLPVVGTTAGLIAASKLTAPGATAQQVLNNGSILMSDGTIKGAAALGSNTTPLANAATQGALNSGAPAAPNILSAQPVTTGAEAGSSWLPSMDSLAQTPGTAGQVLGGAGAAYGAYQAIDDMQHGGSGRAGLTTAGAGLGTALAGPLGAAVGAGLGNLAGYGLQGNGWKNHAALLANPITWPLEAARLAGFNPIHKTTRQVAQEHTAQLSDLGKDDPTYQAYLEGMRAQHNSAPVDPSKPFAGQYATWDEYEKAGLRADDLTGVYGNIKTFGPEWASLTQEDRQKVTQGIIDAGLYKSKKGEVEITDEDRAKQIKDEVLGMNVKQPLSSNMTQAQAAAAGAVKLKKPPAVIEL